MKRKYLVRLTSLNDKNIIWTCHNHWSSGSLENSASKLMHKSEALQKKNAKRNFELWWNVASLRRYGGEFELWKLPTSKHHTVTQCLIASCEGCDHFTRSTLARKWWELYFKLVPFSQRMLKTYYVDCVDRFIDQSTCLSLSAMISYMTSYDIQGFASHLAPESLSSSRKSLPETGAVFRLCWTLLFTRCYAAMYFQGTFTDQCNWWVNKYYTYQTSNCFGLMSMHVHTCAYMSYCMFQTSHLDQLAISQRTVRWWPFGQNDFAAKTSHLRGSPCQVKVRAYPASWCKRVRRHVTPSQVASVAASVASVRQFGPPASLCLGQRPPVNQWMQTN